MQSIRDVMASKKPQQEPPQVAALKKYAHDVYQVKIRVLVRPTHYLISVPTGGIAHKFRVETSHITDVCKLDKKLVIHIGL